MTKEQLEAQIKAAVLSLFALHGYQAAKKAIDAADALLSKQAHGDRW